MASLRNALAEVLCQFIREEKTTASVEELIHAAYPEVPIGDGFRKDALDVLSSVRAKVELNIQKQLVPLTRYYFKHYRKILPENKKEASKCIAGAFGWAGPMVGLRVAASDIITLAWLEHANKSANGTSDKHVFVVERLSAQLGIVGPDRLVEEKLLQLTSGNGETDS